MRSLAGGRFPRWLSALSLVVASAGCAVLGARIEIEAPGTFQGVLPCADCEGIETTLTLRDDALYFLRSRWLGVPVPTTSTELGVWRMSDDNTRVVLSGGDARQFVLESPTRLVQLDRNGQPIVSTLNYALERLPELNPIGGPIDVRAQYVGGTEPGLITECSTGRRFPVARAGANEELARAYTKAGLAVPGAPILVTFSGRLARVTRLEGSGDEDAFVVDVIERVWPGADCNSTLGLPLVGTRWQLTEIDGTAIEPAEGSPELTFAEDRVTGSGGCNRLNGKYSLNGGMLKFGAIAATRRACAEADKMQTEGSFTQALEQVDAFHLERTRLVLTHEGKPLLRFAAGAR